MGNNADEYTSGCLVLNGKSQSVVTLKKRFIDWDTWRGIQERLLSYDALI
jgi:hypothetical protein